MLGKDLLSKYIGKMVYYALIGDLEFKEKELMNIGYAVTKIVTMYGWSKEIPSVDAQSAADLGKLAIKFVESEAGDIVVDDLVEVQEVMALGKAFTALADAYLNGNKVEIITTTTFQRAK